MFMIYYWDLPIISSSMSITYDFEHVDRIVVIVCCANAAMCMIDRTTRRWVFILNVVLLHIGSVDRSVGVCIMKTYATLLLLCNRCVCADKSRTR